MLAKNSSTADPFGVGARSIEEALLARGCRRDFYVAKIIREAITESF